MQIVRAVCPARGGAAASVRPGSLSDPDPGPVPNSALVPDSASDQRSSFGGVRFASTSTVRSSSPHTTYRYFEVKTGVHVVSVM
ncbi:hypothetical protein K378_02732 [Streptomyces sp. Amel2xB2]|nr:hypothetical protein K378_02732 [Streptomyces sp. Amel2xB2]